MLSKTTQYALQAVIYIARNNNSRFFPVKEIAEKNNISYFFLGKIMNMLLQKGLVESYKGPNGGVKLARSSSEITILNIIEAAEGSEFLEGCFIGLPHCGDKTKCIVHDEWKLLKGDILKMLSTKTIDEFIKIADK